MKTIECVTSGEQHMMRNDKVMHGGLRKLAIAGVAGLLMAGPLAAQVTTHFDISGTPTTSTKIVQGGTVTFSVLVDAPSVATIGASFRLSQTAGPGSGVFSITGRSFAGSIYNDTSSGTPDGTVLASPSNILNPDNNDNLGRSTIGLAGAATGTNLVVESLTLTTSGSTALGTYTIKPTAGVSVVTGPGPSYTDYDMGAAFIDVTVGQTLTVSKNGTGAGTVTSDVGLINCGAVCSDIYAGDVVTLTAAPTAGSFFAGWGGACSGTGTCVVTVDAAKSVTATFTTTPTFLLSVSKTGNGTGTVTSSPAGINCGSTCSAGYVSGTVVTLTAVAGTGQNFGGWFAGPCSGTGTCVVTVTAATSVTANFLDEVAPNTTIDSGPTSPSSDPTPTFTFSSDDPTATFQCSLDGSPFTTCTSPRTLSVGNGPHVFQVRARDAGGNFDGTPAEFQWTVVGVVAAVAVPVPTLSAAVLAALMLMVAGIGIALQRKRL